MATGTTRAGKPVETNDYVTLVGQVTNVSGSGPTATLTVTLAGSGNSISAQANDAAAATQTL